MNIRQQTPGQYTAGCFGRSCSHEGSPVLRAGRQWVRVPLCATPYAIHSALAAYGTSLLPQDCL
jgi:hypothetical protein